jgi:mono/diheme cytochrome c family protein
MVAFCAVVALSSVRSAAQAAAQPDPAADYNSVTVVVPNGNVQAGRQAFVDLKCTACHRVPGESAFPPPFADSLGPDLGARGPHRTSSDLATAIISPSHAVSVNVSPALKARLRDGVLSPMGDFSQAMTVRQLCDLVAYLRSIAGRSAS